MHKITDYVFACFDKDSNGILDFSEFIIAYSSTSIGDPKKKLEFVFMFYVGKNFDLIFKDFNYKLLKIFLIKGQR